MAIASEGHRTACDRAGITAGRPGLPAFVHRVFDRVRRPKNALDLHLIRLITIHPKAKVIVGKWNLRSIDDATKRSLLTEINAALGIQEIRSGHSR